MIAVIVAVTLSLYLKFSHSPTPAPRPQPRHSGAMPDEIDARLLSDAAFLAYAGVSR